MKRRFLEIGKTGGTFTKEVINDSELIPHNISRDADYWAVYELEVRDADGVIFISANKTYIKNRTFRSSFKKLSVEDFIQTYPRQTAIISALKSEGVKEIWLRQEIKKLIVYAAKENDESEK